MDHVPNLDCMPSDNECFTFWNKHQNGRAYRELFPQGGKGTKRAAADLAAYASNKGAAMGCRRRGDIQTALTYEDICDRIYDRLPEFARW